MTRTIRERPRLAALLGLGAAGLVAIGLLAGLALAGDGDSAASDGDAAARQAQRIEARYERRLRAARVEAAETREEVERLDAQAGARRSRAEASGRRVRQLERRNRALRRTLTRAQAEN